ncbi:hypothetical protein [Pseudoscardovia radai]|uniref:hypothetical protein n=1 Tax=Pseudoscardovia radai TaxID=987066 RepID=UPI003991ED35
MSDELEATSHTGGSEDDTLAVSQTGNENVAITNYGTVHMQVNQNFRGLPRSDGQFYVPAQINREYYNIFVIRGEKFDKPFFRMPRERALSGSMSSETRERFPGVSESDKKQIVTMPSLFMDENHQYGNADAGQKAIYGFVSDYKIYDNEVKVYWCGYRLDIPQIRLNQLLDELQLSGDDRLNEMNRTHWAIKRCDLMQELQEAGIDIPVFTHGTVD